MSSLEQRVGNPLEKWARLRKDVEHRGIVSFAHVQSAWLDLMWTLDTYRVEQTLPEGFDYSISSEIESLVDERGEPPPPVEPGKRAVGPDDFSGNRQ